MKIFSVEDNNRLIKLKVEMEDDLWLLYNILAKGDIVYAKTTRELKTGSGSKRKSMVLGIKMEWAEFQPFTTRLRVHGTIVSGPKELDLIGQRHTLSIEPGSEVNVFREERWSESVLKKITELSERTITRAVVAAIDFEDFAIAFLRDYGIELISDMSLNIPGKGDLKGREEAISRIVANVAKSILESAKNKEAKVIVLAGPSDLKDFVKEKLKEITDLKIFVEDTSYGGVKGIYEAIKRGVVQRILTDFSIVEEERLMEEFLRLLAKNPDMVAYGLENLENLVKTGAIDKLMVTSELLRSPDLEVRRRVEEVIREAEKRKAKVKIFTSIHNTNLWLKNMGGIAAILRYPLKF